MTDKPKQERKPIEYVVLERRKALMTVEADDGYEATGKPIDVWVPVLGGGGKVKIFKAPKTEQAIEQHTGKGKGAKVGVWKAIAVSAWKGVVEVDPPEQVLQDRRKVVADL